MLSSHFPGTVPAGDGPAQPPAGDGPAQPPTGVPGDETPLVDATRRAEKAGIAAARAVWAQAPSLLPLLAVLCYGLGRLVVDGFYGRLNTTAEAAGVGDLSIIEPAAILAAVLAIIGTIGAMIFDFLQVFFLWLVRSSRLVTRVILELVLLGITLAGVIFLRREEIITLIPIALVIIPLRTLLDNFGGDKNREVGDLRISQIHNATDEQMPWQRLLYVVLASVFLVGLCFGAHEWGVREAAEVAKGKPVIVDKLGINISAISAYPVHLEFIGSSPPVSSLSPNGCLLQIGTGPSTVLVYDPAKHNTMSVVSDSVVVISLSTPCKP